MEPFGFPTFVSETRPTFFLLLAHQTGLGRDENRAGPLDFWGEAWVFDKCKVRTSFFFRRGVTAAIKVLAGLAGLGSMDLWKAPQLYRNGKVYASLP